MRLIDWTNMALMEFYKAIAIDAQPYDSHEIKKISKHFLWFWREHWIQAYRYS